MKAFPSENDAEKQYNWIQKGMDLRDYFAIRFANTQLNMIGDDEFDALETFKTSYKLADIMMKAREK